MRLSTDRCLLYNLTPDHKSSIQSLYTNEETRRFLGGTIPEDSFAKKFQTLLEKTTLSFIVKLKATDEFIGLLTIDDHHDGTYQEISYQFLPKFWGKGLAKEAIIATLDYAANTLNLKEIVAETQSANVNSVHLLQTLQMKAIQEFQRHDEKQTLYYKKIA